MSGFQKSKKVWTFRRRLVNSLARTAIPESFACRAQYLIDLRFTYLTALHDFYSSLDFTILCEEQCRTTVQYQNS